MKFSIPLALLILAISSLIGWQDHQRLNAVRASHAQLVAEAASLGITLDPAHPNDPVRITKHEREKKDAVGVAVAAELIAFAREMEAMEKSGTNRHDEAMQKRIFELMDKLANLDASQVKILIAAVRANTDLKDETRQGIIGFSIMTLASDHPQAALALFTESGDMLKDNPMGKQVIPSALTRWAKDDPTAALDWIRKNADTHSDLVTDEAKRGVITGAALQDPRLAFKLISELGLKDVNDAVQKIVITAKTPEESTATLAALREYAASLTDDAARKEASQSALSKMATGVESQGFEAASKWLATANLSPDELAAFANGISTSGKSSDGGRWIEWMGENLPPEKHDDRIKNAVGSWARDDYQAAGKWLATAPDGPTKNTAIRSYAETLARYEPEAASQWAATLPPGQQRDQTFQNIHDNWPASDPNGKAAFAAAHGIK